MSCFFKVKELCAFSAVLSNLSPKFQYKISVFTENDVSTISGVESFADVTITTDTAGRYHIYCR